MGGCSRVGGTGMTSEWDRTKVRYELKALLERMTRKERLKIVVEMEDLEDLAVKYLLPDEQVKYFGRALPLAQNNGRKTEKSNRSQATDTSPPHIGELLICLFVPPDRHKERLGDFEELFNTVWVPRFGVRLARCVYIAQALRSAVAVMGIGAVAMVADRVWHAFSR